MMEQEVFKAPLANMPKKRNMPPPNQPAEMWPPRKKPRTKEDFIAFCTIVLEYTKYEAMRNEELRGMDQSPLDSGGSTADSFCESPDQMKPSTSTHGEPSTSGMNQGPPLPESPRSDASLGSPRSMGSGLDSGMSGVSDDDSYELITCFCMKPFAGRPMIECSECLTWIHLSCAKIRRTNIPDEFICQKCKDSKLTTRKSNRQRFEKHSIDA